MKLEKILSSLNSFEKNSFQITFHKLCARFSASLVSCSFLLGGFGASAQTFNTNNLASDYQLNTIATAVPFLMISGNAYEMGSANVGVVANNQYHETAFTSNPALLANGHKYLSTRVGYTPWLRALVPDINLVTHSVAGTINRRNALGVYFKYFDLGNVSFTDNTGQQIGSFKPNEFVVQLNYAHWFPMGLSLGVAGKYIYSNLTGGLNVGGKDRTRARDAALRAATDGMNLQVLYVQTVTLGDPDMTALAGMETQSVPQPWPEPNRPIGFKVKPGKLAGSVYMSCKGTKYKKEYVFEMWVEPAKEGLEGSWIPIQSQTSGRYQHEGLERGRIYRFRVYAKNSKGRSMASSEASCAAR